MSITILLDDNQKIKVGEPWYPLAAAECSCYVMVSTTKKIKVGDHDFSKVSVIPPVSLLVNIPTEFLILDILVKLLFVWRKVLFNPHQAYVCASYIKFLTKPILTNPCYVYTLMVVLITKPCMSQWKLSLIALYLKSDLDYLIAARTPPYHSWINPVERVISLLNMGLQCVSIMRIEGDTWIVWKKMAQSGNVKDLRKAGDKREEFKGDLLDSVEPVRGLISQIFQRLKL